MPDLSDASRLLLEQGAAGGAAAGPAWLEAQRREAADRFAAEGLPTPRVEDWKYTNLAVLEGVPFRAPPRSENGVDADGLPALLARRRGSHRLVFVNGRFRADLSHVDGLPEGVEIGSLAAAAARDDGLLEGRLGSLGGRDAPPLFALNTAAWRDGYFVRVPAGVTLEKPVSVIFLAVPDAGATYAYHPRNLVIAEAGSQITVVEHHAAGDGGAVYLANVATEILAGEGATVRHCKIQDESRAAFHVATGLVRLDAGASLDSFVFALGGRLARNEIRVVLDGEGADCRLNGAYLAKGSQHIDNTTAIDHARPLTASREVYKGVLDGRGRGVFQGSILVRPGAQKIDGHQLSRAILLSDEAEIDTKPQLEIYADDVKCSHGATAGELDEEPLFYLRARGIPEDEARRILVEAFLGEVIDGIALAGLREPLEYMVARWMES